MSRFVWPMLMLAVLLGCRSAPKRPPSPANQIRTTDLLALPTPPNERYYIVVFGSQSKPKQARYTHSWATAIKVTDNGPGTAPNVQADTISWMPATLSIRPLHFQPECGVNLDMHTSIREMLKNDEAIVMWGPYEIWHGGYTRFQVQRQFMASGQTGYQCIDAVGGAARNGTGCDCIHAITDMDPSFDRRNYSLRYFGIDGSRHAVEQILSRGVVINAPQTHDWLIAALQLDQYDIERECYRGPVKSFSVENIAAGAAP